MPTQTERTILLLLILVFMATLFPQCWWVIRWDSHATVCKLWMITFCSLLLTTCLIAGTKRQVFVWLVSMLSLLVAYLSSPYQALGQGVVKYYYHLGCDATGLVNPPEAIMRMAVGCSLLFAVTFGFSFLFDRLLGPVQGSEKLRSGQNPNSDGAEKRRLASGRIRLLIAAAAILFTVQALGNLFRVNLGSMKFAQMFLIPATMLIVAMFCCSAVCRLRFLPALFVGVVAVCALTGGGFAQAVESGVAANLMFLVGVFCFCSILLASIFAFLGNSKQPFKLKFGWLFIVTAILACVIPAVGARYDWHSLLLANPLDLDLAASRKKLNSYPGVSVKTASGRLGPGTVYEIVFGSKDADDFFNQFDSSLTAITGCHMNISLMGPDVDLSGLERSSPADIQFTQCELSTQQLADLAELEIPIGIVNSKFIESEIQQLKPTFKKEIYIRSTNSSKLAQFVDITNAFGFEGSVGLYADENVELSAVWRLLEKTDEGATVRVISMGGDSDLESLRKRVNLDRLEVRSADFSMLADTRPKHPEYFFLALESKARVAGPVFQNDVFWNLALGAKGTFQPFGFEVFSGPNMLSDFDSIQDSPFAWKVNPSGEVEKLWLPQCTDGVVRKVANPESLKEISFDIRWLDNEYISENQFFAAISTTQPELLLKSLTNLKALYLTEREIVDLSALNSLTGLETIQFSSSSTNFGRGLFPRLKEVRVVLDKPIKNGFMKELKAIKSLERFVVIDTHATTFSKEQFLKQARAVLGDQVEVSVVDLSDSGKLAPGDFKQHRVVVRQRCIEKYLELPDSNRDVENAQ